MEKLQFLLKKFFSEPKYWLITLFILTRCYIWVYKPTEFTEIIYSYMPYAHLWASGVIPYRQQWFEYPPATIPLFYVPHMIDMRTRFTPFHANYSQAYRGELLLVDIAVFVIIWKVLRKQKVKSPVFTTALLYYIILTAKAHHFIYDTMDLTFTAAMTFGVAAPLLFPEKVDSLWSWFGFWLATALKYVNAPLAPFYAFLERKNWKKLLISSILAGIVVWSIPLALFRSSLLVSLVYQNIRGIQVDSAPAIILRTMDRFTHSEHVIEVYKNYEVAGPMTDVAKKIVKFSFPAALGIFLLFALITVYKNKKLDNDFARIHFTLGYILVFMLTAKVLSTPFLLWHIPLFALYPFKDWKQQLKFVLPSALIIFSSMSRVSNAEIGFLTLPLLVGWIRTLSFFYLFVEWVRITLSPKLSTLSRS
jgi:hypothetical protein